MVHESAPPASCSYTDQKKEKEKVIAKAELLSRLPAVRARHELPAPVRELLA